MKKSIGVNRILWASRRGLLELDLLFEPFVYFKYAELSESEQKRFRRLLEYDDDQLFAWFFGRKTIPCELLSIVTVILDHYKKSIEKRM